LAEGLLQYLPLAAEEALFQHIDHLSAPGSRLAVTHTDGPASLDWASKELGLDLNDLVNSEPRPPLRQRLDQLGWSLRASESLAQAGQRLGRSPTPPPGTGSAPSMLSWASRE
jgi:O-methyltransferase involved in polyketide biosynthesis